MEEQKTTFFIGTIPVTVPHIIQLPMPEAEAGEGDNSDARVVPVPAEEVIAEAGEGDNSEARVVPVPPQEVIAEAGEGDNFDARVVPVPAQEVIAEAEEGNNFETRVVIVPARENVITKIISLGMNWNRDIFILSGIGKVSDAIIWHPERPLRLTGSFDIVTLKGYFLVTKAGDMSCVLNVSLAGRDRLITRGIVADLLKAASPIRLVVGSFIPRNANLPSANPRSQAGADVGTSSRPIPRIPVGFSYENLPFHQVFRF